MDQPEPGLCAALKVFETLPPPNFIDIVRAHVAATGLPETFPGLHLGPISKEEPFYILSPISVPRGKRPDGDMAPCPMCQPNKFLDGSLVFFPRLRTVAVIGHCCATARNRNEAEAEYRERLARERAENYLLDWLPQIEGHRSKALSIRPAAAECQRVFERFRKDGGKYQAALRKASQGGAELTVTEILDPSGSGGPAGLKTSGSTVQTRDVRFGRLMGQPVIAKACNMLPMLDRCLETFGVLRIYGTEESALDFILQLDEEAMVQMAGNLSDAIVGVSRVDQAIYEFRTFFSAANLDRISEWGTHPEAPMPMSVKLSPFGDRGAQHFEIRAGKDRGFALVIEPALWDTGRGAK